MTDKWKFNPIEIVIPLAAVGVVLYALFFVFVMPHDADLNVEVYKTARSLAQDRLAKTLTRKFKSIRSARALAFGGELSEYKCNLVVDYVSPRALDKAVKGPTDYKKIRVEVRHPQLKTPLMLEAIKVNM